MRNDLNRLQIRCVNAGQGCEVISCLENLHTHEDECEFAFISCSNAGKKPTQHTGSFFDAKCKLIVLSLWMCMSQRQYDTSVCVGATGGSGVVMTTLKTSAHMGLTTPMTCTQGRSFCMISTV